MGTQNNSKGKSSKIQIVENYFLVESIMEVNAIESTLKGIFHLIGNYLFMVHCSFQ